MNSRPSILLEVYLLVCAGIVYGSLFPFWFHFDLHPQAVPGFLASWRDVNSFSDILGNVGLFVPYGYSARLLALRSPQRGRALRLLLGGILLAVCCQSGQLFIPGRDPSIADVYSNSAGIALGWVAARLLPLGTGSELLGGNPRRQLTLVIALAWVLCQLLPLVPTIDLQVWKDSLRPLLYYPRVHWHETVLALFAWLTCFHLLQFRVGLRLGVVQLSGFVLALLLLKVLIVANYLAFNATLGLLVAAALWPLLGARLSPQPLAWLLLGAFALYVLAPLELRPVPRDFGWLPFSGYLQGSMLVNAIALCRKVFIFGALALLLLVDQPAPMRRALLIVGTLAALEVLQRWVGLGTPALTDPLLFIAMAWLIQRRLRHTAPA